MPERVYEDGAALIKYGERGDEMYLIRYGKVCGCFMYHVSKFLKFKFRFRWRRQMPSVLSRLELHPQL
jgi:hypothetical protein